MAHSTREAWLLDVTAHIAPWYVSAGHPLPDVKVSCGFPSKGKRGKAIGECWSGECAADGLSQIFVQPTPLRCGLNPKAVQPAPAAQS